MSAEMLRDAAALMRQYAKAAPPSPWASGLMGIWSEADDERGGYIASSVHQHNPCEEAIIDGHARMHIASWHPAVALAVADWLDGVAERHVPMGHPQYDVLCCMTCMADLEDDERGHCDDMDDALAVARAYVGTPDPTAEPPPQ